MRNKLLLLGIVYFFSVLTLVNAATIQINVPELIDGQQSNVNFTINANPNLNGTVVLTYTNLDSSTTSVNFLSSDFDNNNYNFEWQITPQSSEDYSIYAEVRNELGVVQATQNKTGSVESSGPKILSYSPAGSVSSSTIGLLVSTDVDATCKYDTTNKSYDDLASTFTTTGAKNHSQTISGLTTGTYNYYVLCKDSSNTVTYRPQHIRFTVDNLPTAKLKLADPSPVKEGIVEVTLITSKDLPNTPELEYSFNDNPGNRFKISLTGSGSDWHGYMVITGDDDNKVGTFYFSGVDAEGNIGTRITNNNLFIVDTKKPANPVSIKAQSQIDGSIRLNWYYDGEEVDYFNIYRTTLSGVNYVDFYGRANNTQLFLDRSTLDKVTYYYKVAAVDLAGNEGPLSSEVFATSLRTIPSQVQTTQQETQSEPEVPKVLPPDLVPKVEAKAKDVQSVLIDVDALIEGFSSQDTETKELSNKFEIETKVKDAKSKLEALNNQLEDYKKTYATESELDSKLKTIDQEIQKIRKTTPKDARLTEQTELIQSTAKEDVAVAAQETLQDLGLTEEEIEEYTKQNTKVRDDFNVQAEAKIITVTYMDGSTKEQTLITKTISYDKAENLQDVNVVEIIPKKIASHVSEITFTKKNVEVLNEDPVVKFGYLDFNYQGEEYSYSVEKRISLDELQNTKTIVLLSFSETGSPSNGVTGFAIFPMENLGFSGASSLFVWFGILTIISLSVYYMVFVKGHTGKRVRRNLSIAKMRAGIESRKLGRQFSKHASTYPRYTVPAQTSKQILQQTKQQASQVYTNSPDAANTAQFHHLNPINAATAQSQANHSEQADIADLQKLIQQAHVFIEANRKHDAKQLYPHINNLYKGLPKELKSYYHKQCVHLHGLLRK